MAKAHIAFARWAKKEKEMTPNNKEMLLKNKRAPCALIHYTSVYKNLRQSHT
jgi:hypothetical protein